ncbi:MAG: hypothetical protein LBL86_08165 [Coriobacteriales bacterium]|jgi:hypothetical protein|nr:hypothetical protein [Coriobacteriales bacterium]
MAIDEGFELLEKFHRLGKNSALAKVASEATELGKADAEIDKELFEATKEFDRNYKEGMSKVLKESDFAKSMGDLGGRTKAIDRLMGPAGETIGQATRTFLGI